MPDKAPWCFLLVLLVSILPYIVLLFSEKDSMFPIFHWDAVPSLSNPLFSHFLSIYLVFKRVAWGSRQCLKMFIQTCSTPGLRGAQGWYCLGGLGPEEMPTRNVRGMWEGRERKDKRIAGWRDGYSLLLLTLTISTSPPLPPLIGFPRFGVL